MKTKYYIVRVVGQQYDTLSKLWEGNDLPEFRRDGNPYMFDDRHEAKRVLWRLEAKCPMTMETPRAPSSPITYSIETVEPTPADWRCNNCGDAACPGCPGPEQHLACFM